MIKKESTLQRGLPKTTQSICPECKRILEATLYEEKAKVVMEKNCPQHGKFKDVVWSDVKKYLWAEQWAKDGIGVTNPKITNAKLCPEECGLCNLHLSHTCLANIDLTNRCNLKCPICFANANAAGYVYEPSYEQIVEMLRVLRATKPVPCTAVQFSGGEPTLHPRFLDIVRKAKELGFSQIQVATNGILLAKDPNLATEMEAAGVHTVYLQFDGLREDIYVKARGKPLLELKKKAIENCKNVKPSPMSVVLVPTIVNGINDDQVGEILRFAIENRKVIRGVNYQPVSFTGRISQAERDKQRFTLTDLIDRLEKQTGLIKMEDMYPVPFVVPISELVGALKNQPQVAFTSHPHCGLATYLYIEDRGKVTPVTRFINVEGMMIEMKKLAKKARSPIVRMLMKPNKIRSKEARRNSALELFEKYFGRYIDYNNLPKGFDIQLLLSAVIAEGDKKALADFTWKTLFVGGMHFQDDYNYDIERVKRCVIHYSTPDGRIIPFCAYNGGPYYRETIEKKFSVPLNEWRKTHGELNEGG